MKSYGQYCGLSRAAELVGERWTLLVVRDLLVAPRRFNELRHGIPGIPSNLLTTRLRELEEAGVVERSMAGRGVVYRLTEYGRDLEPVVLALGLWGARRLAAPRDGEVPTDSSVAAALLTARTHETVPPFTVEITAGPAVAHAHVHADGVRAGTGPLPDADLRLGGPGIRLLLANGCDDGLPADVDVEGSRRHLEAFSRAFRAPLDGVTPT